jgi:hypothetical protein
VELAATSPGCCALFHVLMRDGVCVCVCVCGSLTVCVTVDCSSKLAAERKRSKELEHKVGQACVDDTSQYLCVVCLRRYLLSISALFELSSHRSMRNNAHVCVVLCCVCVCVVYV